VRHHHRAASQFRAELGLPPAGFLFAVLGSITARKNPILVAGAVAALPPEASAFLLVAGSIQPQLANDIASSEICAQLGHRLILQDSYLDDDTLDRYLAASDCLVLAYSNEGASGLLAKAVVAGVPVLTAGPRSLATDVAALGTGRSCSLNVEDLTQAMALALIDTSDNFANTWPPPPDELSFGLQLLGDPRLIEAR
jgi:glycosyltransferase involved in cell wall biosynthesis